MKDDQSTSMKLINFYSQNKRWVLWISIAGLVLYQIRAGIIPGWQMQSDFPNYFTSSCLLIERSDFSKLYDNDWFQQQMISHGMNTAGKFTPFPPPTVLVFVPLTPFSPLTGKRIWLILNLLLIIPLIRVMNRVTRFSTEGNLLLLLTCGLGLATNFLLGQVYLLLLFVLFAGYDLMLREKKFAGGFTWGLAAAIKFVPVIFLIPFLLKKEKRIVFSFSAGFLLLHLFSFLLMGTPVYTSYVSVFLNHLNGSIEGQSPFAYQFQSWDAFLRTLFVYDAKWNLHPLLNSVLFFELTRAVIYAVVIFIAVVLIIKFFNQSKTTGIAKEFFGQSFAIIGISFFEILPASATYHFVLLVFPVALLLKNLREEKFYQLKSLLIFSFALIGLLPVVLQKIIPVTSFLIFYRLWLMTLLYLIAIWLIRKRKYFPRQG